MLKYKLSELSRKDIEYIRDLVKKDLNSSVLVDDTNRILMAGKLYGKILTEIGEIPKDDRPPLKGKDDEYD